jgi:uncharacterized protein YdaU (DUF1376 family)
MALRDQPYLPLYIQDFLTDEKLIECSAEATGVYIRLMCILHKSEEYGKLLLKQKDKQSNKPVENFAVKISKQMPYPHDTVARSITELLDEHVLQIEGDYIIQKRMVADNALSLKRADAGRRGGEVAQAKLAAKPEANPEIESEIEIENDTVTEIETKSQKPKRGEKEPMPSIDEFVAYAIENKPTADPDHVRLKYMAWKEGGWAIDKKGKMTPILRWRATLLNTLPFINEKEYATPKPRFTQ